MDVSKNRGTPKSSILIGFSIINHPFWGTPIFGNTYMKIYPSQSLTSASPENGGAWWFVGFHVTSRFGVLWDFFLRRMKKTAHKLATNQVLLFVCSSHGQNWEPYFVGSWATHLKEYALNKLVKLPKGTFQNLVKLQLIRLHPAVSKSCRKTSYPPRMVRLVIEKSKGPKCIQMDVSENTGFSPQIIHFNRMFHEIFAIHFGGKPTPIFGNTQIHGWQTKITAQWNTSWWFQPIWKILVKLEIFPK